MKTSGKIELTQDSGERRIEKERRHIFYTAYIPERRLGLDRRYRNKFGRSQITTRKTKLYYSVM